jgi:diguanylate cyclase (GGDEF)-like protein/PAS domain S-box-containing protein
MAATRVMVVEDSSIVALDIQRCLNHLGYTVCAVVPSGEEAILKVAESHPELILMDIMLKGEMDGIEAAEHIFSKYQIPVIFLTAYSDEKTLSRAKLTKPFGYLIKPFEDRVLHTTIELALYKFQMEKKLKESEERYRAVIEQAAEGIYLMEARTHQILETNGSFEQLLGYTGDELKGRLFSELLFSDVDPDSSGISAGCLSSRVQEQIYRHRNGTPIELETSANKIILGEREVICGVVRDIRQRKRAEEALKRSEAKIRALLNAIPDLMIRLDEQGVVLEVKEGRNMGNLFAKDALTGKQIYDFLPPRIARQTEIHLQKALESGEPQSFEYEIFMDGALCSQEARIIPDGTGEAIEIIRDFTERKQMEEQLKFLSFHDALTGLFNRTYFEDEMNRLATARFQSLAIILCDVDGLKLVNDTLGHDKGDQLLVRTASILNMAVKEITQGFSARIGGDEFAILIQDSEAGIVEELANRIHQKVFEYNEINPDLPLSVSVGLAYGNGGVAKPTALFKEADDRMYREKLYRIQSTRSTIVQALMKVLETKDFITEGHVNRLQGLITHLATAVGLSEHSVTGLRLLAQFHDIGKVGTPDRVLFKPGPLDQSEQIEMRRHCEIGHRIAQSIPDLVSIADLILKHHEWWNGSGYPLGIKERAIPLECRILAIVDAYDAMTSDRPYRKALTRADAFLELRRCAGVQFDPELVELFISTLEQPNREQA